MLLEKLPGINIQAPWARLILSRDKTVETRTYRMPEKYVGKDMWLIETPGASREFRARIIGVVRFCDCIRYVSRADFESDYDLHRVGGDSEFRWDENKEKYGWVVEKVEPVKEFTAPTPRGILYSKPFDQELRF